MIDYYVVFQHVCLSVTDADLQDELWSSAFSLAEKELLKKKSRLPYVNEKIIPKTFKC